MFCSSHIRISRSPRTLLNESLSPQLNRSKVSLWAMKSEVSAHFRHQAVSGIHCSDYKQTGLPVITEIPPFHTSYHLFPLLSSRS